VLESPELVGRADERRGSRESRSAQDCSGEQ
jgi:hypothetical protein